MRKLSLFLCCIIVASVIITACFSYRIKEEKISEKYNYKGVLSLWQIDSFEGGTGSRKQFLMKVARGFEKENEGVYTMVISHTLYSANESIKNGEYPDMISFGAGVSVKNFQKLISVPYFKGGDIDGRIYATPWCRGGYVLISKKPYENKKIEKLIVSEGEYTQPYVALLEDGIYAEKIIDETPLNAYVKYLTNEDAFLLGTQRDIMRLTVRGEEFYAIPLTSFNDLYQYISVCSNDKDKTYYSEKFVQYLLKKETQEKLSEINMFSVFYDVSYSIDAMVKINDCKYFNTLFAFSDIETLKNLREISKDCVKKKDYENFKIKNMLL